MFGDYVASTTSASRSRTARRSRSTTRTASPSCSSSTTNFDDELDDARSRRPSSTRTQERQARARVRAASTTLITRDDRLETIAEDLVATSSAAASRQGDGRLDRQGHRRADVRQGRRRTGPSNSTELQAERDALPRAASGRGSRAEIALDGDDRHGGRRLAGPERDRRPRRRRASTSCRTASG